MDKKKKFDLILPESMTLPDGVELPNIETETATIRKTIIGKDGSRGSRTNHRSSRYP